MFEDVVGLGRVMHDRIRAVPGPPPRAAVAVAGSSSPSACAAASVSDSAGSRAAQVVRGRTQLHCFEAHLVTGLHRYAKQCSGRNVMPCLHDVCNKLYLIRKEVKRTHEGAALSRQCSSQSWWFMHMREAVARLCVVLWSSAQATPHFMHGSRKENFRQFCVGVVYSFKRGFEEDGLVLVPQCAELGNVLPNFRSPRDKSSKHHHGNFRISHHRGIRLLHDAYSSVAVSERRTFWRDAALAASHVKNVYAKRCPTT